MGRVRASWSGNWKRSVKSFSSLLIRRKNNLTIPAILVQFISAPIHLESSISQRRRRHPPSPPLTTNALWPWGCNYSRVWDWEVNEHLPTVFALVFNPVIVALRRPRFEGEAIGTLLGAKLAHRPLAWVRPVEKCARYFGLVGWGDGPVVHYEDVCVGP
jgi:hypothetical protein